MLPVCISSLACTLTSQRKEGGDVMHVPVGIALDPLTVQPFSSSIWLVSQSLYVYALSDDTSHLVCLFVSRQAQVRENMQLRH